jgi:hypothetical protein
VAASSLRVTEYSLLSPFRTIVTFAKLPASTCRGGVNPVLLVAVVTMPMVVVGHPHNVWRSKYSPMRAPVGTAAVTPW